MPGSEFPLSGSGLPAMRAVLWPLGAFFASYALGPPPNKGVLTFRRGIWQRRKAKEPNLETAPGALTMESVYGMILIQNHPRVYAGPDIRVLSNVL